MLSFRYFFNESYGNIGYVVVLSVVVLLWNHLYSEKNPKHLNPSIKPAYSQIVARVKCSFRTNICTKWTKRKEKRAKTSDYEETCIPKTSQLLIMNENLCLISIRRHPSIRHLFQNVCSIQVSNEGRKLTRNIFMRCTTLFIVCKCNCKIFFFYICSLKLCDNTSRYHDAFNNKPETTIEWLC